MRSSSPRRASYIPPVPTDRDLFANFERMRREMDELFGEPGGWAPGPRGAFSPAVDVYYLPDPPRAVVRAELAGIKAAEIELEIRGRELILAGQRQAQDTAEDRLYQQLEVQHGPFRRVIALGADVDADAARATYEDGMLTVELPIVAPAGSRTVPVQRADEAP
jgi:HSP20 family protein